MAGQLRVLIVEDETLVGMGLKHDLELLGHQVVAQSATPDDAMTQFNRHSPQLILMDIKLSGGNGIDLAARLQTIAPVPVIFISAFSDQELLKGAADVGAFGYLIKPIEHRSLAAQIEVSLSRYEQLQHLHQQNAQLTQSLTHRKLIEKAKGIFMRRMNLDEAEAHKRLQQESQKRRISLPELAQKIIDSEELLGR